MKKEQFLNKMNAYGSHRTLLWNALEDTKHLGKPVLELGSGPASTPFLRTYCSDNNLGLFSYDNSPHWAAVMKVEFVPDWDKMTFWKDDFSVVLLDLAPGEYRKVALMKLKADIIVIHDSEPVGWNASDYQVRPLFNKFKYKIDDIATQKGDPWTTALSNTIDVSKWKV